MKLEEAIKDKEKDKKTVVDDKKTLVYLKSKLSFDIDNLLI